jgi:hypothetical protein
LARDKNSGQVLAETIRHASGVKTTLLQKLADLAQGLPDSTENTKEKEQDFNAVLKLKEEADKARLEESIVLDDHILVNRNATAVYKDILGNGAAPGSTGNTEFAQMLYESIKPNFGAWLEYCASAPQTTSGTCFVILNIFERGSEDLKATIRSDYKTVKSKLKIDLVKMIAEKKKTQKVEEQAKPVVNKKRKRQNQQEQVKERKFSVEILVNALS